MLLTVRSRSFYIPYISPQLVAIIKEGGYLNYSWEKQQKWTVICVKRVRTSTFSLSLSDDFHGLTLNLDRRRFITFISSMMWRIPKKDLSFRRSMIQSSLMGVSDTIHRKRVCRPYKEMRATRFCIRDGRCLRCWPRLIMMHRVQHPDRSVSFHTCWFITLRSI